MSDPDERKRHWDLLYASRGGESASWFQSRPSTSLDLIAAAGAGPAT